MKSKTSTAPTVNKAMCRHSMCGMGMEDDFSLTLSESSVRGLKRIQRIF